MKPGPENSFESGFESRFESRMAVLAREQIRPAKDLGGEFPLEIWQAMGRAGLLDPDLLAEAGPSRCLTIARTARTITMEGGNLGMALSWMIHHLVAGILVRPRLGEAAWAADLWQRVRKGDATICLAVSEPDAGAHPKYMTARADAGPDGRILSGEKTYLTNGPIASAYAVVAITGGSGTRKEFSAFLVDRDTPGLTVSGPMEIPFFRPSPHGSLSMTDCIVPEGRLLGGAGQAFPELVLPFRRLEDAVMTGPVSGAMDFVLDAAARALAGLSDTPGGTTDAVGRLKALVDTALFLSDRIAERAEERGPENLILYFRQMAAQYLDAVDRLMSDTGITLDAPAATMLSDLSSSARIGKTVSGIKLQKLGRAQIDRAAGREKT